MVSCSRTNSSIGTELANTYPSRFSYLVHPPKGQVQMACPCFLFQLKDSLFS